MNPEYDLDSAIRKIPDFPKPGILFYDITSVLSNPEAFRYCIDSMHSLYENNRIDAVAAIEARGFIFASPFALEKKVPLILIRKKGKLPGKTVSKKFCLEYGEDEVEMHRDDIEKGQRILIVDDLIATGGTVAATCDMIRNAGGEVAGVFGVIGLPFLQYEKCIGDTDIKTLINYDSE